MGELFFNFMESFHYSVCPFYKDAFLTLKGSSKMTCIAVGEINGVKQSHAVVVSIDKKGDFSLLHDPYPKRQLLGVDDISRVYTVFKSVAPVPAHA